MKRSASYFCTWNAQNFGRKDAALEKNGSIFLGSEGAKKARDAMNEEFIFGPVSYTHLDVYKRQDVPPVGPV